jgi:hypothetical protein
MIVYKFDMSVFRSGLFIFSVSNNNKKTEDNKNSKYIKDIETLYKSLHNKEIYKNFVISYNTKTVSYQTVKLKELIGKTIRLMLIKTQEIKKQEIKTQEIKINNKFLSFIFETFFIIDDRITSNENFDSTKTKELPIKEFTSDSLWMSLKDIFSPVSVNHEKLLETSSNFLIDWLKKDENYDCHDFFIECLKTTIKSCFKENQIKKTISKKTYKIIIEKNQITIQSDEEINQKSKQTTTPQQKLSHKKRTFKGDEENFQNVIIISILVVSSLVISYFIYKLKTNRKKGSFKNNKLNHPLIKKQPKTNEINNKTEVENNK